MCSYRQRLLDNLTTPETLLRGVAGVHSNDLMPSTLSLGSEDVEERAPGSVRDRFRQMMVLDHAIDVEILNSNMMILLSVLLGDFEMKVSTLTSNLEMGLSSTLASLATAFATLFTSGYCALLAPEGGLALTVVAWISNGVAFRVSQEGQESNINADIGMLAHAWGMLILSLSLTDDEGIPVSISMQNEMGCLGCSFDWAVQFDLDGTTQLLGNGQMFPIRVKREISLVLPQLDGMPPIGFLEAWKAALLTQFSHGKEPFERFIQAICQHLDGRSGNMLSATTTKPGGQIILHEKLVRLLIVLFGGGQHLVIEMPRLNQAGHEFTGLLFIWVQAIFKRSHIHYFTANELSYQVGVGPSHPTPKRNASFIPKAFAQGLSLAEVGNFSEA